MNKKKMIKICTMAGAILLVSGIMVLGFNKSKVKADKYIKTDEGIVNITENADTTQEEEFDYQAFFDELNAEYAEEEEDEDEVRTIVSEGEYGIKTVHHWYKNKVEKIIYDKDGNVIFREVTEF